MLPRANRLRRSDDIVAVLRRGSRRSSGPITAYSSGGPTSRATVIVDKKVSKRAVVRNQVKRRIRAVLHEQLPAGNVVIRAYPGAETLEFNVLREHVLKCLLKA